MKEELEYLKERISELELKKERCRSDTCVWLSNDTVATERQNELKQEIQLLKSIQEKI